MADMRHAYSPNQGNRERSGEKYVRDFESLFMASSEVILQTATLFGLTISWSPIKHKVQAKMTTIMKLNKRSKTL